MKQYTQIFCKNCEGEDLEYEKDNRYRCLSCKKEFDLYDSIIDPINLQKDLLYAWNEAEENLHDLENLTNEQIIECRDTIKDRIYKVVNILHNLTE